MKKNASMRKEWGRLWWLIIWIILCCPVTGWAQQPFQRIALVTGEVASENAPLPDNLMIERYDMQSHLLVHREFIVGGRFEFRHVETGCYKLRVASMQGDTVYEEFTQLSPTGFPIQIRLPSRARVRLGGGTVSVGQLLRATSRTQATELHDPKRPHVRLWAWMRNAFKRMIGSG